MPKIKGTSSGLNDQLFREVITSFQRDNQRQCANIVDFTEASWGLNFSLTPVQRFMLKCFYGLELNDVEKNIVVPDTLNSKTLHGPMSELEFARWSYEEKRCNIDFSQPENQGRHFYELQLVLGRRSGKSTLCSIVVDYEFYRLCSLGDPHEFYNVPPGQEIAVVGTAPTDGQAQIIFDMAQSFFQNSPIMRDRLTHATQTYFQVQTDHDVKQYGRGKNRHGSLQFLTGGSSSTAIRGHNAIIVLIDEMAFFLENAGKFSIDEVYGALTPSIAKFSSPEQLNPLTNRPRMDGKVLCISSPYAHFGKFYNLYRDAFSNENQKFGQRLVFRYYSALVNPDNANEDYLRDQRRGDRAKFRREFEAEFDERITSWIDSETTFRNNVRRPYQPTRGQPGVRYFWGFDLGVTDNGTGVAIVHRDENQYVLDYSEVFYSGSSPVWEAALCGIYKQHPECARWRAHAELPLFEIAKFVYELNKKFPIYRGFIDQYSGHAFYQILVSQNVEAVQLHSVNDSIKCKMFQLVKDLYTEGLLNLMDHPVLIPELLNLEVELRPQNKVMVNKRACSDGSFQDDLSDAVIRAIWDCWTFFNVNTGPSSKNQVPAVVSFGNGRRFANATQGAQAPTRTVVTARNLTEYKHIKRKMHGSLIANRTPSKGKKK